MNDGVSGTSSESVQRELEELKCRVAAIEAVLRLGARAEPAFRREAPGTPRFAAPEMPQIASSAPAEGRKVSDRPSALETRIGAQLLNRVGIFAVLAAAAWFLKLAIDRAWIGPGLRVLLGLAVSAGLMGWSERFRRDGATAFAYSLKALGAGIAYLSLWACFALYHLLPAGAVFAGMVAVTATNAILAWRQESGLLAALALAGGLATPALLSTGDDRELFLLWYLVLLDLGAAALTVLRPWPGLAIGAFAGTTLYLALGWSTYYSATDRSLTGSFLALFFALFTAVPFVARHGEGRGKPVQDAELLLALPIAVGACAFLEAAHLLAPSGWIAAAAAILGMLYLILTCAPNFIFRRTIDSAATPGEDRDSYRFRTTLDAIHLGLAVAFATLAALLHFKGYGVALGWVAELGLLAGAAYLLRGGPFARPLHGNAVALLLLSLLAVLMMDKYERLPRETAAFLNAHFAVDLAGLSIFAAVVALRRLSLIASKERRGEASELEQTALQDLNWTGWGVLSAIAIVAFNLVALVGVSWQIGLYWRNHSSAVHHVFATVRHPAYVDLTYSAWFMIYGAALMAAGFFWRSAFLRWQALGLLALSIGKVFLFDTSHLTEGYRVASFLGLGVLLLAVSYVYQRDWLGLRGELQAFPRTPD